MGELPLLVAVFLAVALVCVATEDDVTPRLSFLYDAKERSASRFSADGVFNYTSLLLSREDDTLYVGAREALFALNLADIGHKRLQRNLSWGTRETKREECSFKGKDRKTDCLNYIKILLRLNGTHLYVCGTHAFSPICAYINTSDFSLVRDRDGDIVTEDGRNRCPFSPEYKSTAIMVDGELYAGTVSNFQGNEHTIYKSLGHGTALKTENSLNWLQDPAFVGSAYIREGGDPANDKVYFFFSEAGKEFDFFDSTVVSRIARVCKGDVGGERVLQKKWTTFLKAQLLCSLPDDGFPFNIIQDMFVLTADGKDWNQTTFYGVFTSQWYRGASGSSAVCSFTMDQVDAAFNGRYREVNRETQQWYTYNHAVPEPRPGACITGAARHMGVTSSLQMPDKVLNFVKDHFLMDDVIRGRPLLLKRGISYTQIAVDRVQALHGVYDVLFIGTDDGKLHKAVNVDGRMHIIEEMVLFHPAQPVQHIELDSEKGLLFASSYSGLVSVPMANCSNYQNCGECVLSRDPYCVWTGKECVSVRKAPTGSWQDVDRADTKAICSRMPRSNVQLAPSRSSPCQVIIIPANSFRILPCKQRSLLAKRHWAYNEKANRSVYHSSDGGLVVVGRADSTETYECWSEEGGFRQLLANYCVRAEVRAEGPAGHSRNSWLGGSSLDLPDEARSTQVAVKTYWNELVIVCVLLGASLLLLSLLAVYRHRGHMKAMLKEGECPSMVPKKARGVPKPAESLPLNGNAAPPSASDHKGYQTLNDVYACGTPPHEQEASPDTSRSFSESEKRPLHLKESRVEISPSCSRPRVRLGPDIKDSVV
ncbi:semaphorin-4B-like [Paramormyrops kingsleyae]|uniref:Semaphorin 4B n=1 Tax=Paramormyrops kingsleyae TaxID=1676925 RepID=A0A3B3QBV7_9TELE|nr:semaphorin-4B-like [Paramormyrops kingsleyae]XP_023671120.1 semaphorin-4B-like [Paramormyrops kingsleyae]XP_023671121.1 semaphorin-4B-like [Paramormyrops kingsleyae]XP_023671122.1 semaphorin-4B-like [Paramormyrops kingsleyae]XP_023671123.1 semaphorin-4B-like [Paramormyrops kingsleyae]